MAYAQSQVTHGGIAFYTQVVKGMLAAGWTLLKAAYQRADYSGVGVVQSNTKPIAITTTGFALPFTFQLPVMFMSGTISVKKDYLTDIVAGLDYNIDPDYGTITVLAGGAMDNGAGFGTGQITIEAGYDIKQGWVLLHSTGISGGEDITVGLRFAAAVANPTNPVMTGIEVSSWASTLADANSYTDNVLTRRSHTDHDVLAFIPPNADVQVSWSLTLDRIIFRGRANCFTAWCAAGSMARVRPVAHQKFATGHVGNTTTAEDRAGGPVGKTTEAGDLSLAASANMGSVWLYEAGAFPDSQVDHVELNANYWSNEVGHPSNGYTASRRVITAGSGPDLDVVYFEIHNVIVARDIDLPIDEFSIIYGVWEGLYTVLCYEPADNLQLTMDGRTFRLWAVGDSLTRFIAVEEL